MRFAAARLLSCDLLTRTLNIREDLENSNHGMRNSSQTYRKMPDLYQTINTVDQVDGREVALKFEREKAQIQAEAKKREEKLLKTIRQQQEQLDRLQQAFVMAEQNAKVKKMNN